MHPVRKVFKSNPPPRPVAADLVYFPRGTGGDPDTPEFWSIRLYRDNFDRFSKEDQHVIFNWVSDTIRHMRIVDPNCFVEVFESEVPR